MVGSIVAWTSHKGGSGRTVSLVNVAFHLASRGHSVALVDLDLPAPTMGAVLQYPDVERGAENGVHHLLNGTVQLSRAANLLLDAWASPALERLKSASAGDFRFLPGSRSGGDLPTLQGVPERLATMLEELRARFEYVFLDLRSGIATITSLFVRDAELRGVVDDWIMVHRWTRQHLFGVAELMARVAPKIPLGVPRRVITAEMVPARIEGALAGWARARHSELLALDNQLIQAKFPESGEALARIPDDPVLRWADCVITPGLVKIGALDATYEAFARLAEVVQTMTVSEMD